MPLYLEDLLPGQCYAGIARLAVTAEQIAAFAQQFDPQPFHLDPLAARDTLFGGLAASGWHTGALTMRLLLESDFQPAGGIIGTGFEELSWPRPVRPGDTLHVESEILEVRPSRSRPTQGLVKVRTKTFNQHDEAVQVMTGTLVVACRPNTPTLPA